MLARNGVSHLRDLALDRWRGVRPASPRGAVQLRRALTELGPAYVKLGQLLSTRADLLPPGYQHELAKLQARVPSVPFAAVTATLEAAWGRPAGEVLAWIDREPLAAASIGQVHRGRLPDGTEVVVKVRRPDVGELIERDVSFFSRVAELIASMSGRARDRFDPEGLASEFATALRRECDYLVEADVAERLADSFGRSGLDVHIPAVHRHATTSDVLMLDLVTGIRLDDTAGLRRAGIDPSEVAERFAEAFMSMVFTFGLFHADPHPGNVFVQPDGSLSLIDFGKHGEIDAALRVGLGRVLGSLLSGDLDGLVDALEDLRVAGGHEDRAALRGDLAGLVERYGNTPIGEIRMADVLSDMLGAIRRHRLRLPPDLMLLLATVVMCEGVAVDLDPDFELQPVLLRWAAKGLAG